MTSRQFIEKWHGVNDGIERYCSSIYKDGKGYIYSYGLHYPLLFTINGVNFVNNRGYSNTTSRHIHWAWGAINYNAIGVELDHKAIEKFRTFGVTDDDRMTEVKRCLYDKHAEVIEQMEAKKRKDTQVYKWLEYDAEKLTTSIKALQKIGA